MGFWEEKYIVSGDGWQVWDGGNHILCYYIIGQQKPLRSGSKVGEITVMKHANVLTHFILTMIP